MLIIILIQLFGGDSGYYGYGRFGAGGGAGTELGTILIILLIVYMLGGFRQVLGGLRRFAQVTSGGRLHPVARTPRATHNASIHSGIATTASVTKMLNTMTSANQLRCD